MCEQLYFTQTVKQVHRVPSSCLNLAYKCAILLNWLTWKDVFHSLETRNLYKWITPMLHFISICGCFLYTWFSRPWKPCKLEHTLLPTTSGPRLACTSSEKTVQNGEGLINTVLLITNYCVWILGGCLPVSGKISSVSLLFTSPPKRLPVKWKFRCRKSSTFEKRVP